MKNKLFNAVNLTIVLSTFIVNIVFILSGANEYKELVIAEIIVNSFVYAIAFILSVIYNRTI